jgi:hypothetical protein
MDQDFAGLFDEAVHERITLDQAYELPTLQFLGDLSYIKAKSRHEQELIKEQQKKMAR